MVKGQNRERRNRERQRDRSNLGGALAPPTPWRPWTRGETLLPSREKVKEEEEGGGSLPLAFGGTGVPPGPSSSPQSTPTTSPPSSPTLPPLCSGVTPLLPDVIST